MRFDSTFNNEIKFKTVLNIYELTSLENTGHVALIKWVFLLFQVSK